MAADHLRDLRRSRFRANPLYQLVAYERLTDSQRELLSGLTADPDFFGVLIPRDADGRSVKSVQRDTAKLIGRLTFSGDASGSLPDSVDRRENPTLARLVLDGVLEIETGNGFVSGAEARAEIFRSPETRMGRGRIFALSVAALQYGQRLPLQDRQSLSARLYFYNRLPVTPAWVSSMPTEEAALRFLELQPETALRDLIDATWRETPVQPGYEGWRAFVARAPHTDQPRGARFKLYVSPAPGALVDALLKALPVLRETGAPRFKIGRDVYNLLRPDKLVVYFPDFEALSNVGDRLADALQAVEPHGVPFTCELAGDGLLSWGADPPPSQTVLSWQERESWRLWLTNRLAAALLDAKAAATRAVEPWRYALDRLRLENVDTSTWSPSNDLTETHGT